MVNIVICFNESQEKNGYAVISNIEYILLSGEEFFDMVE